MSPSSCPPGAPPASSQKLLAIPGPIQLSPAVQQALAHPPLSHVSPEFVKIFQDAIRMTREVVYTSSSSTAFILAGSGTLGWDQVGANLIEPGDRALVLQTGYFGEGFKECLETYGAQVTIIAAPLGGTVAVAEVEAALLKARKEDSGRAFKLVTITHVDTSTGVLADAAQLSACVARASPGTLVVLDAVCSLASEDVRMDAWGLDVVLSASQKGLGAPPGLSVLLASPRAITVWENCKARSGFYSSWAKWLPIMRAYDAGRPAYFGTPAVSIVRAYHASLAEITRGAVSLAQRLKLHRAASARVKAAGERLGMRQLCSDPGAQANGMTAFYVPRDSLSGRDLVSAADVLGAVGRCGVVMAGGLVAPIKERYVRIGHMGWSVVGEGGRDVDTMIRALDDAVKEVMEAKGRDKEKLARL